MSNYYYPFIQTKHRKSKKKNIFSILLFILLIGVITYIILNLFNKSKLENGTILPLNINKTTVDKKSLKNIIESNLDEADGYYGIFIKNIKSEETYSFNEHKVFETASLYKLWVMAVVYNKILNGELKEDQVVSEEVSVLNDKFFIASQSAEQTEGKIELSVNDALNKMITISDNYAAMLLVEKIRLSTVKAFLNENDFVESNVGTKENSALSTPYDIALFLEKLYKGEFANKEFTEKMIDLLKKQKLNNKLPKYLPSNVIIAHKTGEFEAFTHDAGIVFSNNGDYIIVVMSESQNPFEAEERIAKISRAIYYYFNNIEE